MCSDGHPAQCSHLKITYLLRLSVKWITANLIRVIASFSFAWESEAGDAMTQRDSAWCPEVTCRSACL